MHLKTALFIIIHCFFASEAVILPTEIIESHDCHPAGRRGGQLLVDSALCCVDRVLLSQKKLPYMGSCLHGWVCAHT